MKNDKKNQDIAIVIPCYNEEATIAKVIKDFKEQLPEADIFVFDNNSSDQTEKIARESGAKVYFERRRGKGYVVQRMFRVVNADIIVLVDGDDTYSAKDVHDLLDPVVKGEADMTVGNRLSGGERGFTISHRFGNLLFRHLLNYLFRANYVDILSGYRVMHKSFYKKLPLLSSGFEIETEMTLQSLERGYCVTEIPVEYDERPKGSYSKIRKFQDGSRIILTIVSLLRDYRPMTFFAYLGGFFVFFGVLFGSVVLREYYDTGIIQRVPTTILSIALVIIGVNAMISGLILSAVNRRYRETEMIIRNTNDKE